MADPEDGDSVAQRVFRNRKELESLLQDLQEISAPLRLACSGDPTPVSLSQLRSAMTALDNQRTRMIAVQATITRYETDADAIASDTELRRTNLKTWDKVKEMAVSLKLQYEAIQHRNSVTKKIERTERIQAENPTRDYSKSMTKIQQELSEFKAKLNEAELVLAHELWADHEDLDDRLQNLLSFEVTPPDTKNFSRMPTKNPYKISHLVVPTFNGKIEQWISFWEEFQHAVHSKTDMDDCTKLVYLKQAIQDPGLKSTIADLGIKDGAYQAALKLLQDRFNKPRIVHRQCCEAMKSIPTNNNSRASLTAMADKVQHIVTGLTRLESLGASEILTSLTELSMNKELKHQWLNHTSKLTTTPPVKDVIAFIREKADQAEGEESTPTSTRHSEKNRHQKPAHQKAR